MFFRYKKLNMWKVEKLWGIFMSKLLSSFLIFIFFIQTSFAYSIPRDIQEQIIRLEEFVLKSNDRDDISQYIEFLHGLINETKKLKNQTEHSIDSLEKESGIFDVDEYIKSLYALKKIAQKPQIEVEKIDFSRKAFVDRFKRDDQDDEEGKSFFDHVFDFFSTPEGILVAAVGAVVGLLTVFSYLDSIRSSDDDNEQKEKGDRSSSDPQQQQDNIVDEKLLPINMGEQAVDFINNFGRFTAISDFTNNFLSKEIREVVKGVFPWTHVSYDLEVPFRYSSCEDSFKFGCTVTLGVKDLKLFKKSKPALIKLVQEIPAEITKEELNSKSYKMTFRIKPKDNAKALRNILLRSIYHEHMRALASDNYEVKLFLDKNMGKYHLSMSGRVLEKKLSLKVPYLEYNVYKKELMNVLKKNHFVVEKDLFSVVEGYHYLSLKIVLPKKIIDQINNREYP